MFGRTAVDTATFILLLLGFPGCHRQRERKKAVLAVHAGVITALNRRRVITFVWFLPARKSNEIETTGFIAGRYRNLLAFTKSVACYVRHPLLTS